MAGTHRLRSWIVLVVVAAGMVAMETHHVDAQVGPGFGDYVAVYNELTTELTVHCRSSSGVDLGLQFVAVRAEYKFDVALDAGGNADYMCRFESVGHGAEYHVFTAAGGNTGRCGKCLWLVSAGGFYLKEDGTPTTGVYFGGWQW